MTHPLRRLPLGLAAVAALGAAGAASAPETLHSMPTHMYITRMAYRYYASRYEGGELSQYIGDTTGSRPAGDKQGTVVEGAFDEDVSRKNPWDNTTPWQTHFWDCRQGPAGGGFGGDDNAVDRAHKYMTGGYALDGRYDAGWSENHGEFAGVKGEGVLSLYSAGRKAKAYWYLGHAAHFLEDLTVPAHTLLWAHPFKGTDAYESYMGDHAADWGQVPEGPVESFDSFYDIYYRTADTTNDFDAGFGPDSDEGPGGKDGKKDRGARRAAGFTEAALKEEGAVLMPLAYRRVAALFVYFYRQVDRTPPSVRLEEPLWDGARVYLKADARDDESGVDRRGYRFEYALWTGASWSSWREVTAAPTSSEVFFDALPGRRYAFRASAVDAAGNHGRSPAVPLTTGPAAAAAAVALN